MDTRPFNPDFQLLLNGIYNALMIQAARLIVRKKTIGKITHDENVMGKLENKLELIIKLLNFFDAMQNRKADSGYVLERFKDLQHPTTPYVHVASFVNKFFTEHTGTEKMINKIEGALKGNTKNINYFLTVRDKEKAFKKAERLVRETNPIGLLGDNSEYYGREYERSLSSSSIPKLK